jgi:hypothetical protein
LYSRTPPLARAQWKTARPSTSGASWLPEKRAGTGRDDDGTGPPGEDISKLLAFPCKIRHSPGPSLPLPPFTLKSRLSQGKTRIFFGNSIMIFPKSSYKNRPNIIT